MEEQMPIFVHSEEEIEAAMARQNITRNQAWDMLTQSKSFEYRIKKKREADDA